MNYLGLDYGLTHLGIAFADGPLASPLKTIPTSQAQKLLPTLIDTHQIDAIIIGRPDKSLSLKFKEFINYLKNLNLPGRQAGCKLKIVDETLSSHDARQKLMHTTQSRRRTKEHSVAATLILQSWLDSRI